MASQTTTVNFANAPQGTHFVTGFSAPVCTVNETTNTVSCTGDTARRRGEHKRDRLLVGDRLGHRRLSQPWQLHDCHAVTRTVTETTTTTVVSTKNGRLTIPAQSETITSAEALADFTA
jgi:hypothetical protein